MARQIMLNLPEEWEVTQETFMDEMLEEITHLEAHLFDSQGEDLGMIDVCAGGMPEDETAYDQAFANYADMVGFSEEDEMQDPIKEFRFNGKKAFGFLFRDEEGAFMSFTAQESKKGLLMTLVTAGPTVESCAEFRNLAEKSLRIK